MSRRLVVLAVLPILSGCVAAAVPAMTVGGSYLSNAAASSTLEHAVEVDRMNCRQLQAEYDRLDSSAAVFNPFAQVAGKKFSVLGAADRKGCRLRV